MIFDLPVAYDMDVLFNRKRKSNVICIAENIPFEIEPDTNTKVVSEYNIQRIGLNEANRVGQILKNDMGFVVLSKPTSQSDLILPSDGSEAHSAYRCEQRRCFQQLRNKWEIYYYNGEPDNIKKVLSSNKEDVIRSVTRQLKSWTYINTDKEDHYQFFYPTHSPLLTVDRMNTFMDTSPLYVSDICFHRAGNKFQLPYHLFDKDSMQYPAWFDIRHLRPELVNNSMDEDIRIIVGSFADNTACILSTYVMKSKREFNDKVKSFYELSIKPQIQKMMFSPNVSLDDITVLNNLVQDLKKQMHGNQLRNIIESIEGRTRASWNEDILDRHFFINDGLNSMVEKIRNILENHYSQKVEMVKKF